MSEQQIEAFLDQIPPFDRLPADQRAAIVDAISEWTYAANETILDRWQSPTYFHLVVSGTIEEFDAAGPVALYARGDGFDAKALIEGRSEHRFVTREPASLFRIPAALFLTLTRSSPIFGDFYRQDIRRRLDALVTVQQQREAGSFLMARIGEGHLAPPLFAAPETTIHEAVALMKERGTSAILVRRGQRSGIFTGRDVRERLALMRMAETTPIGDLASYNLVTLEADDFLFNAFAAMTRHSIRHVVITEGPEIVGVLEQADLWGYLSNTSFAIANRVERAGSVEELKDAGNDIPRLIRSLYERGVKPRYIARLVTDLNRKVFRRIYEELASPELIADSCLVVMGSEGRGEQLLRTDQDNGIILRDGPAPPSFEAVREALPKTLIDLGYPPCPGNVMTSNPAWAKPLDAFKHDVIDWIHQSTAERLMNLAIFVDATAVAGDGSLLATLKSYLFDLINSQEAVLRHFARAIEAFDTPIGLFNRFVVEKSPPHDRQLDIKKGGIFPIVHGVRTLALERRLIETNTIARIRALRGQRPFGGGFTPDLIEALEFMSMLRMREQLDQWERGVATDNYVTPGKLNKLERGLLRDSLKIAKQFKAMIARHFNLRLVS